MKNVNYLLLRICAVFVLLFACAALFGQDTTGVRDTPFFPGTNSSTVFTWYQAVYGGLITVLTYLQGAFFPKAGKIPSIAVRYILIAGVTAILFITLGFTDGIGVFIGFVGSALTYDKVLKPLGLKTATPKIST